MDSTVTHEQLRAGQLALLERFDRHEQQFRDTTTKLFEKVDRAVDASNENRVQIAGLQSSMGMMLENRAQQLARFETVERKVEALQIDSNVNQGKRSVLAEILRSPFIAWVAAMMAALWAAVKTGLLEAKP